jgi:hypothetical protein
MLCVSGMVLLLRSFSSSNLLLLQLMSGNPNSGKLMSRSRIVRVLCFAGAWTGSGAEAEMRGVVTKTALRPAECPSSPFLLHKLYHSKHHHGHKISCVLLSSIKTTQVQFMFFLSSLPPSQCAISVSNPSSVATCRAVPELNSFKSLNFELIAYMLPSLPWAKTMARGAMN